MRLVVTVLLSLVVGLLAPRAGLAQPSIATLRDEVQALRDARPEGVSEGALVSLDYSLDVASRIERNFVPQSAAWRARVARYLERARAGRDPYLEQGGQITNRGYVSPLSSIRQGYAIYLPPGYDPSRTYPLLVMLHGGSSNGNLFLGVVLGNNMDWLTYDQHLWDEYTPRWSPDWIVVAPDGFGQVLWRWMGEADVLAVIDDVQRHYSVDADRVVLGGLSNGGLGAYALGIRQAWRFSMVQAIAGAPSWLQYTGGTPTREETLAMTAWSGMDLIENSVNTDFRFYHGTRDPGPMRPAYVQALEQRMRAIGLQPNVRWFDFGHDLLYLVHRHGRVYPEMAAVRRDLRPREVRVVTGDYRASRQHWVSVSRIERYPALARVVARASDGAIDVETNNTLELALDLRDAPIGDTTTLRVVVDGADVYAGPRAPLGHVARLHREEDGRWQLGRLAATGALEKVPGVSGPLTDAYYGAMIHVYGTLNAEQTEGLRQAAQRGARGWPLWLWNYQQRVVADVDVTDDMMQSAHLVLYGTPGSNALIERFADRLPIHVESNAIVVGARRIGGEELGVRFIHPNPDAPTRYVVVQAGTTVASVLRGHNLPDFLPDWVVYDQRTAARRARLISGRNAQRAMGYFDRFWRVADDDAVPLATQALEPTSVEGALLAGPRLAASPAASTPLAGDRGGVFDGADEGPSDADAGAITLAASSPAPSAEELALRRERARILGVPLSYRIPPPVLRQSPPITLPITDPPPTPPPPTRFSARASDPAGVVARQIATLVPTFLNFRAIVPGASWTTDPSAVWQIEDERACLRRVREASITTRRFAEPLTTPVATPLIVSGTIDGVELRTVRPHEQIVVSCELAARLPRLAAALRAHGVRALSVLSAYRPRPTQSFHTLGLALDVASFELDDGTALSVQDDFVETPDHRTCEAPPPSEPRARALLEIACAIAATHAFSSVLTPNYNDGHRNHFHLDARPDDPRLYVR